VAPVSRSVCSGPTVDLAAACFAAGAFAFVVAVVRCEVLADGAAVGSGGGRNGTGFVAGLLLGALLGTLAAIALRRLGR